jgi:hypothetical protein
VRPPWQWTRWQPVLRLVSGQSCHEELVNVTRGKSASWRANAAEEQRDRHPGQVGALTSNEGSLPTRHWLGLPWWQQSRMADLDGSAHNQQV